MILNYKQFLEHLKENIVSPVYLFSGEENYFKQEALREIEKKLFTTGEVIASKEFNYNCYSALDVPAETIISILTTVPFLAEKRLVVVKNIDEWKEKEEQQIINYLDKAVKSSCFLLITSKRIDPKNPLSIKVNQVGIIVDFVIPFEKEILSWIRKRFNEEGKIISPSAAELLLELTGNNLFNLNNEIEKICLYNKEKREIHDEIIFSLSAEERIYQINELNRILFENKPGKALKILNNLITEGEKGTKILGSISQRVRQFIYALSLKEQKLSDEEIRTKLKISKFFDPLFFTQVKKFDKKKLNQFLEYCLEADFEIKTGQKTAQIALENLILKLSRAEN